MLNLKTSQLLLRTVLSQKLNQLRFLGSNIDDPSHVKYVVSKNPAEWKYVENILPPETVPKLCPRTEYNSDFRPPDENMKNCPYYIARTKNHMLPVYLKIYQRGIKRLTYVRKIEGDIWLFSEELKKFLQPMCKKVLRMQVNEFTGIIVINGDYVNAIKYWLTERKY